MMNDDFRAMLRRLDRTLRNAKWFVGIMIWAALMIGGFLGVFLVR